MPQREYHPLPPSDYSTLNTSRRGNSVIAPSRLDSINQPPTFQSSLRPLFFLTYAIATCCFIACAIVSASLAVTLYSLDLDQAAFRWAVAVWTCIGIAIGLIIRLSVLVGLRNWSRLGQAVTIPGFCLSGIIFLVAVSFCVRGFWRIDFFRYGDSSKDHNVVVIAGQQKLVLALNTRAMEVGKDFVSGSRPIASGNSVEGGEYWLISGDNEPAQWFSFAGFLLGWGPSYYPFFVIGAPPWFIGLMAGGLSGYLLRKRDGRRQRLADDLCPSCGYDLRRSPDRCPECGEPRLQTFPIMASTSIR